MDTLDNKDYDILKSLTPQEREATLSILGEFAKNGSSKSFDNIKYADYEEIPVSIDTFLDDPKYLGVGTMREGKSTVFPYWRGVLRKVFPDNVSTAYNTLVLTGAIGLGKSFIAVICILYMLYRTICLKDPYEHYGLQRIDVITFAFMNITLHAAEGVAWSKCQELLQASPWFMSHGHMSKSVDNPSWVAPKGIELLFGSTPEHVIGRCLDGNTVIVTENGEFAIKDLVDKDIRVVSVDSNGCLTLSNDCSVKQTAVTCDEYKIELQDGTVIECTPEHRFMLFDGSYKEAKDLTEDDELFDCNITYDDFIKHIIETRGQWNISDDNVFEVHHIIPRCIGGHGNISKCRKGYHDKNLIYLYPREHFIAHMLLAKEHPDNKKLVLAWSMMAFPKGKTERCFPISPLEYEKLRTLLSKTFKNNSLSKGRIPWNAGLTKNTDERMRLLAYNSKGKHSAKKSEKTKKKMSASVRKRFKEHPEQFASNHAGMIWITNDIISYYIHKDDAIPSGFHRGLHMKKQRKKQHLTDEQLNHKREMSSGKNNGMYGMGYKLQGGKNGNAKYIYTFENVDYQCRDDLMQVLRQRWKRISEDTIRRLMKLDYGTRLKAKYKYVIDNLTWRLKKDEDKVN